MRQDTKEERKIQSQKIVERVLQRALCDNVIVPLYDKTFIYDNAANRLGKGMDHTLIRVKFYGRYVDDFYFFAPTVFCTETGKVVRKINKNAAVRMRRKMKTFNRWVENGKMTKEQAVNSYCSWKGHMKRGNSYTVLKRMNGFVNELIS